MGRYMVRKPAMATVIPPSGVESPYPPELEPRRTYTDSTLDTPMRRKRWGAGLWIPVILGILVVLGLLYWLALPRSGWNTAANTTTINVGPSEAKSSQPST